MKADVVIIGSGVTGLTAAALLSRHGKRVMIFEKQPNFGGALRQFKRNLIPYDVGFHYTGCLGEGEILNLLWKYCGIVDDLSIIPLAPDGYDHFGFRGSDKVIKGYFDYERLTDELISHFPKEQAGIRKYFNTIKDICLEIPFYNTELSLEAFLRSFRAKAQYGSLVSFLDTLIEAPQLKAILGALSFLYGVPTQDLSLENHALIVHGYHGGAYTVGGGGQSIVDSFLKRLEHNGVECVKGCAVEQIVTDNNKVTGVRLGNSEVIACDQVIYTGHPSHIIDMVPPSTFRPAYKSRIGDLRNSLSLNAVFGRSELPVDTLVGAKNYYLLPEKGDVIPQKPTASSHERPIMMTNMGGDWCLQEGRNSIILLGLSYWQDVKQFEDSTQKDRPPEYQEYKNRLAREMIETVEERWGNICGRIEPLAVGTPITFRDELHAPEGCSYGAMHCLDQFNPDVRTRLPGLYLCGQSTIMTGVVGSSISGLVGAGEILGMESLWNGVRRWV